jgi:2-polyprenyl-6-methoxyphenol hydroxylase-like FAD-dependent oxidoreductase
MTDTVIVAGGGAAGLMLACELRLASVPTVVLERSEEAPTSSCGMLLHSRAYDALRCRGIAGRFGGRPRTPIWPRTHFGLLWLDLSGELGETDYDLIVPQWRTQQLLEERAVELGAEIRRGRVVTGVEQDADGVTVTARGPGGEETLRGGYLVGCDGENSTVGRLGGFTFDVMAPSYYGVIADVRVDGSAEELFEAGAFPAGQFGWLPVNPTDPHEIRLMTVEFFREPQGPDVPVTVQELKDSIRRITGTSPEFGEPRWITRYGSPTRLAENYRNGRVLLAGDAAHPHPPSSGNGLVTAVHDVFNLGWKLAGTVHGWAPDGLLDTYHDERHPVGRRACVRALAQISIQHPPEQVGPIRELFTELLRIEEVNRHLVQMVTKVRYPLDRPGTAAAGHPLLGAVLPDTTLTTADGPAPSLELLAGGRGLLLTLAEGTVLPDTSEWAGRIDVLSAAPSPDIDAKTLLVRPDGHVVWADPTGDDHDGLLLALKSWFG